MTSRKRIKRLIDSYAWCDKAWVKQQVHKLKRLGNDELDSLITQFYLIEDEELALKHVFGSLPGTIWDEFLRISNAVYKVDHNNSASFFLVKEDNGA